jgi:hypothetical protein
MNWKIYGNFLANVGAAMVRLLCLRAVCVCVYVCVCMCVCVEDAMQRKEAMLLLERPDVD